MTELKSCPFCGEQPEIRKYPDLEGAQYSVDCLNDSCQVCACCVLMNTKEEAIEAWNTRAERTCKNLYKHADSPRFWCSECDFKSNWPISDGRAVEPRRCPNCGAKVVE